MFIFTPDLRAQKKCSTSPTVLSAVPYIKQKNRRWRKEQSRNTEQIVWELRSLKTVSGRNLSEECFVGARLRDGLRDYSYEIK